MIKLKQEEMNLLQSINNREKIEKLMREIPKEKHFTKADRFTLIRNKSNSTLVDFRRINFYLKNPRDHWDLTAAEQIDGVYRIGEYLNYVEYIATPDCKKFEIWGFTTSKEFANKMELGEGTVLEWKRKDAFKDRVVKSVQRSVAVKAANVINTWYDKLQNTPERCSAADFSNFLKLTNIGETQTQGATHITAIKFEKEDKQKVTEHTEYTVNSPGVQYKK